MAHVSAHLAILAAMRDVSKLVVKELTSWVCPKCFSSVVVHSLGAYMNHKQQKILKVVGRARNFLGLAW